MDEISLLIGGKAGFGIDRTGTIVGRLLNRLGYRIYIYRDYPSLIRGGHTFSIIRASKTAVASHREKVDFILALNQETLDLHKNKLKKDCMCIYDSGMASTPASTCCLGLPLSKFLKDENAPEIMRNTCMIGALTKAIGVDFCILEDIFKSEFTNDLELNLKVAKRAFDEAKEMMKLNPLNWESLPLLTGNQAIALGLIKGGLNTYIAYPMTPSSPILHFLAEVADDFSLDVIHPESEIAVILMALGFSYMGKRAAIGTSGGGFCLMTEGLSFAAMAELPIVIVLGSRPGPSTGLPTYSAQAELHFALNAGHGEFTRFVVAPGDTEEAFYWSSVSLDISWRYQIPAIILSDKNLGEGVFNFNRDAVPEIKNRSDFLWDGRPLSLRDKVIKVNSYEHDEFGITTEDPKQTTLMQDKRLRKESFLTSELKGIRTVNMYDGGLKDTALLCWGSNKGVCVEVGERLGIKVIQPIVLHPFPIEQFQQAASGVKRFISVENNATGQLARLIRNYGFDVDESILKYDGRPFNVEELEERVKACMAKQEEVVR